MCEGLVDKMAEEGSRGMTDDPIMKILVFNKNLSQKYANLVIPLK